MNVGKIIPAIIGGLLLSFLGRSCTNSDWYSEYTKKQNQQKIEKIQNQIAEALNELAKGEDIELTDTKDIKKKEINIGDVLNIKDIKEEYLCVLKDVTNVENTKWTLAINKLNVKNTGFANPDLDKFFSVKNSCCPEESKKFAIYDELILKWFDLIDHDLYFNTIEQSDNKVKHKKFSIKFKRGVFGISKDKDYKKFKELYSNKENSKKNHSNEQLTITNPYFMDEEKFFYAANTFFKKDDYFREYKISTLFDADCE